MKTRWNSPSVIRMEHVLILRGKECENVSSDYTDQNTVWSSKEYIKWQKHTFQKKRWWRTWKKIMTRHKTCTKGLQDERTFKYNCTVSNLGSAVSKFLCCNIVPTCILCREIWIVELKRQHHKLWPDFRQMRTLTSWLCACDCMCMSVYACKGTHDSA